MAKKDANFGKVLGVTEDNNWLLIEHNKKIRKVSTRWCSTEPKYYVGHYYTFSNDDLLEEDD